MALVPSKLSDFRLLGPLGERERSRVYDAVHLQSQHAVVIKALVGGANGLWTDERLGQRVEAQARLSGRHVVRTLGFGVEREQPFLVLEKLEGESIEQRLQRHGPAPSSQVGPWIAQALAGLRECHAQELLHRDVRAANFFLQQTAGDPVVKLIDFGAAWWRGHGEPPPQPPRVGDDPSRLAYWPPEQFEAPHGAGVHSDLYAMGVLIYRCLSGQLPYKQQPLDELKAAKLGREPRPISSVRGAPALPALDWLVLRAMARRPEERFESADEMLSAWHEVMVKLDPEPAPARPSQPVIPAPRATPRPSSPSPRAGSSRAPARTEPLPRLPRLAQGTVPLGAMAPWARNEAPSPASSPAEEVSQWLTSDDLDAPEEATVSVRVASLAPTEAVQLQEAPTRAQEAAPGAAATPAEREPSRGPLPKPLPRRPVAPSRPRRLDLPGHVVDGGPRRAEAPKRSEIRLDDTEQLAALSDADAGELTVPRGVPHGVDEPTATIPAPALKQLVGRERALSQGTGPDDEPPSGR